MFELCKVLFVNCEYSVHTACSFEQEALLLQRDRTTRLLVEILQLKTYHLKMIAIDK